MSVRWMQKVWEHSRAQGNARLVLLAIADCANDEDGMAWPSFEHLAHKTLSGRATVARAIKTLEQAGELTVEHSPGRRSNRYRLNLIPSQLDTVSDTMSNRLNSAPTVSLSTSNRLTGETGTIRNRHSEPSGNHHRAPKRPRASRRVPEDFGFIAVRESEAVTAGLAGERIPVEWQKFRDCEFRTPRSDWPAAWRNWCRRAIEIGPQRTGAAAKQDRTLEAAQRWVTGGTP